jgi:hypothetical protein
VTSPSPDYLAGWMACREAAEKAAQAAEDSRYATENCDHGYGYALACRELLADIRAMPPPAEGEKMREGT